ncbi:hypothetical protein NYR75_09120 [Actinobacillus equuli subsp. haemolyticus]|uniref:hypothetical protein n=1 Tax=Actinobacillus equuli TaxID=718 RepID=UPI0024431DA1|nr:hypothetical protein [Actinobacillus equuli]WGE41922.1 hypothetical protein NYR64_09345 [Actinobacillus equuli subsp. haemolyticus]WGE46283.1 hypothetical protein NYR84_09325 [Actinobacillus equuli subsp. haemolyticus]WGE50482.1 hypothetical protein NYR68_09470 [Actinobacillus equuli subsp. haemolyticus]WGE52638.1 hypothetical protein NYR69_09390 [Actinobacillus equuli subsp. haemolyticus]WGE58888.1 hypothetical protein NYR73_09390 [Actinobacillus equuli subsp. haemolyticus]
MLRIINKIVSSSLSMAFLGALSWSAAYSYGWAQAYFYGFSWWYVDVGAGNVARSLGYVLYVTLILCSTYLIGLFLLVKAKPYLSHSCIKMVRAGILCAVTFLPILIVSTLITGKIYQLAVLSYFGTVLLFTLLFWNPINRHIGNINIHTAINFVQSHKNYVMIFTYAYFVLFAFLVGYLRPHFKTRFDMLEVDHNMYYVLAKYNKTFILSKELKIDNDDFYLYELIPNQLGHVQMVCINHPF